MDESLKTSLGSFSPPKASLEYCKLFEPAGIRKVTDRVYFALGYDLANTVILEGDESLIVIDTTSSVGIARKIADDLRKITTKRVSDVIYTHSHPDHIMGTVAFVDDPSQPPKVWAHETFGKFNNEQLKIKARVDLGICWQMGWMFRETDPDIMINAGLGPSSIKVTQGMQIEPGPSELYLPNEYVRKESIDVVIAGIPLKLVHLPGETTDHLCVWWPEAGVLCPGDNIYNCFPSLWPIRGSPFRDPLIWSRTLEKMAALKPKILVPCHGTVVYGEEEIQKLLNVYGDAITFVHDQTVRLINKGFSPVEMARKVKLPPSMADHPYLQQHYAYLPWMVRAIYCGYVGWFSGTDLLELSDITYDERASKLVNMIGREKMMSEAKEAMKQGDVWWAIELTSYLWKHDKDEEAWSLRKEVLFGEAQKTISSHERSALLTNCLKNFNIKPVMSKLRRDMMQRYPFPEMFEVLKVSVNPEKVDPNAVFLFDFTDKKPGSHKFTVRFRHSVLHLKSGSTGDWTCKVVLSSETLRSYLLGDKKPINALVDKDVKIEGAAVNAIMSFLSCFDL